jgi:hypothetical protein
MDVSVEAHTVATITSRTEAGLCKVAKRKICVSDSEALSMSLQPVRGICIYVYNTTRVVKINNYVLVNAW